jgi:hypothetical protein
MLENVNTAFKYYNLLCHVIVVCAWFFFATFNRISDTGTKPISCSVEGI